MAWLQAVATTTAAMIKASDAARRERGLIVATQGLRQLLQLCVAVVFSCKVVIGCSSCVCRRISPATLLKIAIDDPSGD